MKTTKIIGYGIVGKNMHKIFPKAVICEKKSLDYNHNKNRYTDIAFICVPTPMREDGSCDFSAVEEALKENPAGVYCIRSTIPPGTTRNLMVKTQKKICFSPEYYGETKDANNHDYDFLILGGDPDACDAVAEVYKQKYTGKFTFHFVQAEEAEITKYMENSFLATKVIFCQEFYRLCKKLNVNYNIVRELFNKDPRINPSHTFVYDDQPYYDSKCLNKDVPAITFFAESKGLIMSLLTSVMSINTRFKNETK